MDRCFLLLLALYIISSAHTYAQMNLPKGPKPVLPAVRGRYTSAADSATLHRGMWYSVRLWNQGKLDSGVIVAESVLAFARDCIIGDNHPDLALSMGNLGMLYNEQGRYADAKPLLIEALAISRRLFKGDYPDLAHSINNLATFYHGRGQYADAESLLLEALAMNRRLFKNDHADLALSINNVAGCYNESGRFAEAEPLLLEALAMRRRIFKSDHPDLARSINNVAMFYGEQGRYSEAEPLFLESLAMSRRLFKDDHPDLARIINNLATYFYTRGHYTAAEPLFLETMSMRRRLFKGDHPDLALSINNIAGYYNEIGRFAEAEPLLLEALAMRRRLFKNDHPDLVQSLNNLAMFYNQRGRYAEAEPLLCESLAMGRRLFKRDHPDLARSVNNLAAFYNAIGRYAKAEPLYLEALGIYRRLHRDDHPDLAGSINNVAAFYMRRGRYVEAETLYTEALAMNHRLYLDDHPNLTASIINMAAIDYKLGRYVDAESLYVGAVAMYRRLFGNNYSNLAMSITDLAYFYEQLGRNSDAELLYLERLHALYQHGLSAARFGSERDQLQFAAIGRGQYDHIASFIIRLLLQRPTLTSVLAQLAIESKSSVLECVVQQRRQLAQLRQHDSGAIAAWDHYIETGQRLERHLRTIPADSGQYVQWQQERTRLEGEWNAAEQRIARRASALMTDDSIDWRVEQCSLHHNEAAIEFLNFRYYDGKHWTDSTFYYAIIIRPGNDQPIAIRLCEERTLDTLLRPHPLTSPNSYLRDAEANIHLYQNAFAPLEQALVGVHTAYLSPTGLLSRISFAALHDSTGLLLADRFDLRYVSNTRVLATPAVIDTLSTATAAIFGGSIYNLDTTQMLRTSQDARRSVSIQAVRGGDIPEDSARRRGLDYLPQSRNEADAISRLLTERGWNVECDTGLRASEERFKSISSPTVLHVATHGFFFTEPKPDTTEQRMLLQGANVMRVAENPMLRSGLLLSGAERAWNGRLVPQGVEDGIVTAYEIASMDLSKTQLVVLSACGTGLGDIQGSEGVFGLQRAFRIAGAKSVIMTLWNVGDATTEEFMREFYTRWLGGKTQHESFAEAQAAIREKTDDPRDWAAYVLVER